MTTIPINNVFSLGRIINFEDKTQILERDKLIISPKTGDNWHTVKTDDRVEQLAWFYYRHFVEGPMYYWFVICDANNITNPLDLSEFIGKEILIPDIMRIKLEFDI
jgi:hypothetical protein